MLVDTLTLIHIDPARDFFHDGFIFFTWAAPQVTIIGDTLRRRFLAILKCLTLK